MIDALSLLDRRPTITLMLRAAQEPPMLASGFLEYVLFQCSCQDSGPLSTPCGTPWTTVRNCTRQG